MSAAASAAGYLYVHGQLITSTRNSQHKVGARSSWRPEPRAVLQQDQLQPVKQARMPRIEYRKRRYYPSPSAE